MHSYAFFFSCDENFKICSLSHFWISHTVLLFMVVIRLCTTSPGLLSLRTGRLYLLATFTQMEILDLAQAANKNDKPLHPGMVIEILCKSMNVI